MFPIVGDIPQGLMTMSPGCIAAELDALRASGTVVFVRYSRLPLDINLMDPAEVSGAVVLGVQQGADAAAEVAAFWR